MHAWEAIQNAVEHIETHLGDKIKLEELAQIAALSPFYFQRLFSRLVKKPVMEYVKLRRLAKASGALANSDKRILDIALSCGFGSHAGFTRMFREAYGLTPEAYRGDPVMLNQFDKPDLLLNYVMVDTGVPLISDGLVLEMNPKKLESPVTFMGVTGHIPIEGQMVVGEATGVDLPGEVWQRFHREKTKLPRVPNGREVGVAFLGDAPEGSFTYFAGAEVAPDAQSADFETWRLPAREYIVCGFEAENFEALITVAINKAVKFCRLWLEKHNLTMEEYSPEIYYYNTSEVAYMELWMPANVAD